MNGYILENQVTPSLRVTYAHQHLIRQPIGRKMKDKNGHYSSYVLVLGVCLFELSFFSLFLLSSRSTVSSLLSPINIYMYVRSLPSLTKECSAVDVHALFE